MPIHKTKTPPSPTPKADRKRVEILTAANTCFRRTGFHQTSMQEICAEIGLGPGAVYRYFSSKESIIEAMADHERREARSLLTTLQEADYLPDAIMDITHAFAKRYASASDVSLMTEVFAEGLRNTRVGQTIGKTEEAWIDGLGSLLQRAQARGQIDPTLPARETAVLLTAVWDGLIIRLAYTTEEQPAALLDFVNVTMKRLLGAIPQRLSPREVRSKRIVASGDRKTSDPSAKPGTPTRAVKRMKHAPPAPDFSVQLTLHDNEDQPEHDVRQMSLI